MKTRPQTLGHRRANRASAAVVVLALLFLMVAFIAGNSANLHSLELELRRVERLQLRKYQPGATTNALAAAPAEEPSRAK